MSSSLDEWVAAAQSDEHDGFDRSAPCFRHAPARAAWADVEAEVLYYFRRGYPIHNLALLRWAFGIVDDSWVTPTGFVYLLRAGVGLGSGSDPDQHPSLKIGYSSVNAKARARQLQTGNAEPLFVVMEVPGAEQIEARFKCVMHEHRARNGGGTEWFAWSEKMDALFDALTRISYAWALEDSNRPRRRPFDHSVYLGIDVEYQMALRARAKAIVDGCDSEPFEQSPPAYVVAPGAEVVVRGGRILREGEKVSLEMLDGADVHPEARLQRLLLRQILVSTSAP